MILIWQTWQLWHIHWSKSIDHFCSLRGVCRGYSTPRVTPYTHPLPYHFFYLFSSMAVWKNSQVKEWRNYDEAKRVMFHKSNKWDAAEDILCRESTSGVQKYHQPGAPNDGFLLNTLKTLFTFRYLEMYSKQRYKICICSAILDELESFRSKLQGFVMSVQYFPENFRCNLK